MLTESKTEILLKIGAILGRVHIGISIVDADKIGVLAAVVLKIEVDEVKIDEVLTGCPGAGSVEEVIDSLVDEVLGTSTVEAWSWEVLSVDWVEDVIFLLAISPVEADSTDVTMFGGV